MVGNPKVSGGSRFRNRITLRVTDRDKHLAHKHVHGLNPTSGLGPRIAIYFSDWRYSFRMPFPPS
jgi:hypothetical protein